MVSAAADVVLPWGRIRGTMNIVRLLFSERGIACGLVLVASASCGIDRAGTEAPLDGGYVRASGSSGGASSSGASGSSSGIASSGSSGAAGDDGTGPDGAASGDDGSTSGPFDGGAGGDSGGPPTPGDGAAEAGVDPCVALAPCCNTLMLVSAMSYSSCEEGAHSGDTSLCQYLLGEFQNLGLCK
jgi:hypothetical protein